MNKELKTNIIIMVITAFIGGIYGMSEKNTKKEQAKPETTQLISEKHQKKDSQQKEEAKKNFQHIMTELNDMNIHCFLEEALGSYILNCSGNNSKALFGMKNDKIGSIQYSMNIYEHELVVTDSVRKGKKIIAMGTNPKDYKKISNWVSACGREDGYGKKLKLNNRTYYCSLSGAIFTLESIPDKITTEIEK